MREIGVRHYAMDVGGGVTLHRTPCKDWLEKSGKLMYVRIYDPPCDVMRHQRRLNFKKFEKVDYMAFLGDVVQGFLQEIEQ